MISARCPRATQRTQDRRHIALSARSGQFGRRWVLTLVLLTGIVACSKQPPTASSGASVAPSTDGTVAVDSTQLPDNSTSRSASADHARDEVWVDADGQKYLGKVPFDAFFDEPYAVASNQSSLSGSEPAVVANGNGGESSAATSEPVTMPDETPAADPAGATDPVASTAGSGDDWGSLISAEALDEEVKSIRNFMNENLQSVGAYNSAMLMLPPKAASLAALAEVASKHPEAVSWKDDAAYIRDLGKQMNASALQRGAKDQKRLLELYEAVSDTLNRSRPASLAEPPAGDSFAESAEMRLVMMRMEEAEKRMRTEAGSEAALSSKKTMVAHEASLMAVMAKVVTQPGYGYEDDPEFTGYGAAIVEAAQSIKLSAESGDFAGYEAGLSKISTTCQNCHSKYKND